MLIFVNGDFHFQDCMTWLRDSNLAHKRLAAQLCGIFAAAEGVKFEFRMRELLPEFIQILEPLEKDNEDRDADLLLIQTFYTIIKIAQHCPIALRNPDYADLTDDLWTRVIQQMLHPHLWIRTLSARLVGTMLGWHKVEDVAACVSNQATSDDVSRSYLISPDHVAGRLRSLASESVGQLQSGILETQLADQVIKNLVYIAKIANRLPPANAEQELGTTAPTLPWLTGKLRREINAEVALRAQTPIKVRNYFISWI
jgi:U3 small nucleolar RNA-associated protein 20